jgi:hypothetical protein
MSPRAAWRLEALGYDSVYDYAAGKADWLAAGLPTVTGGERPQRAADVMDRSVATCRPDQVVAELVATGAPGGFLWWLTSSGWCWAAFVRTILTARTGAGLRR